MSVLVPVSEQVPMRELLQLTSSVPSPVLDAVSR
jgi:hypothetical protein